jgi:hypothetical protein
MGLFAQRNRSIRLGRPVAGMAIFLFVITIPLIAAAGNGGFASFGQGNSANDPALIDVQSFNEPLATSAKIPAAIKRGFYLTLTPHAANTALTACSNGYHMASIWELMEISTLNYHYKHPNALKKDDSGNGPPSGNYGWVRTGGDSSASAQAGKGNCSNWTSVDGSAYGTVVYLTNDWKTALGPLGPWGADIFGCDLNFLVWCVSNTK